MQPVTYRSSLLDSLPWLRHAFQPCGVTPPPDSAYGIQRHTAKIVADDENFPAKQRVADGIISQSGRTVAICTADCLPVLIADTRQHYVAAIHAGLKGTVSGILKNAIDRLIGLGTTAEELYVAIGPALQACCYEIGPDLLAELKQTFPDITHLYHTQQRSNVLAVRPQASKTCQGAWLDLPKLGKQLCTQMGVLATHIDILPVCTYCMAERYASYRHNTHHAGGYKLRYSWIRSAE